jgi:hypothetical protein
LQALEAVGVVISGEGRVKKKMEIKRGKIKKKDLGERKREINKYQR